MSQLRVNRWEAALLIVGTLHVLLYALLVPPWYHYDEPASLEYALLIRELGRLPSYDEHIPALRQAIGRSMRTADLFAQRTAAPDVAPSDRILGFNQRVHPPLYYRLIALATLPAATAPIAHQLALARLASTALAACCLYLAVRALRLLLPTPGPRLFTLAILAALPPFADIMSAVNSDVLANTVAVALLWAASRLLTSPSWPALLGILPLFGLAFATKRSATLTAGLLLLLLLLAAGSRLGRRLRLAGGGLLLLTALALATGVAALPQRQADWAAAPPGAPAIVRSPAARSGGALFTLARPAHGPGPTLEQELEAPIRQQADGRFLTLTGWIRADRPATMALSPALQVGAQLIQDSLVVGTTWAPVSVSAYVPADTPFIAVRLHGPFAPGVIFYDDLALVIDSAPAIGLGDGIYEPELLPPTEPANLLRNPGGERATPDLRAIAPGPLAALLTRSSVDRAIGRLFAPRWQLAVYPLQLQVLFAGFWGTFSWGEVHVPPGWLRSIGLLTGTALLGALRFSLALVRGAPSTPLHTPALWWLCLGLTMLVWAGAVGRVLLQPVPGTLILGFGRYTYPALLPGLVVLGTGLYHVLPPALRRQGLVGAGLFLWVYAGVALVTALLPM